MARSATPPDPQVVTLSERAHDDYTQWLTQEITHALNARAQYVQDGGLLDTWQGMYEQAQRPRHQKAWPDAADLASYIPTEYVDSMAARLADALLGVSPICNVEGWGESSQKAAKVEAFHEWQAQNERLKKYIRKAIRKGLIEGNGILEVVEQVGMQKTRTPFNAAVITDIYGAPALGADLQFQPKYEAGKLVEWDGNDQAPYLKVQKEAIQYVGQGPSYRVLSCKDFLYLPIHAKDIAEVWGYAKRFWLTAAQLKQRASAGIYRRDEVEKLLASGGHREPRAEHHRQGVDIAPQDGPTREYELWEVHLSHDIDGDTIPEWLISTVSVPHTLCLRLAFDSFAQARFVDFCPFPREDSVWGYNFIGHKLWTLADEHTALRNMKGDRQAMATAAPLKVLTTSVWDHENEPLGAGSIIPVRSMGEIEQLQIADVPLSVIEGERDIHSAAERIVGLNDAATIGVTPSTNPSATQIATVAQASFGRVKDPLDALREALEDLYQIRHRLWERALEQQEQGLAAPWSLAQGLSRRGIDVPTDGPFRFTAADLKGHWRFVPYGSVETANRGQMAQNLNMFIQVLPMLFQLSPGLAQTFQTNPQAGIELFEQVLRINNIPNMQVFLQQTPGLAAPQGVGMSGAPGQPAGLPPMLEQGLPMLLASLTGGPMAPQPEAVM